MGQEVFSFCKVWLRTTNFPNELNFKNVVLILKKDNASCLKDLRPIALCNVLYKILAKVLSNRMKEVFPFIISENQSAFVKNRGITDNVLVVFQILHHMSCKKRGEEGEVALKLDIIKAYDRVSWSFLKQRMRIMGFCEIWIDWMMLCVKTVTYNFCFNDSIIGPIIPKKGLRQGDPLSPYLFLLCVEGLSNALDVASDAREIKGCKSVNFQKSGVYFIANVRRDKQRELSSILGVYSDLSNTRYLGLPSLVGKSKKRVFSFLKDKATKRIQGWKVKPISQAGKTVLIRNVAQAIPSYSMSCFLIPKTLCQELERMFSNYWWRSGRSNDQKGVNWLAWSGMSTAKSKGGLGFRNLYGFNIALLGKHIWNFLYNPNSLVDRLFKAKYFPSSNVLKAGKWSGSSFVWHSIWTAKEELCNGFRWVLGNDKDIVATKDPWLRKKSDFRVENSAVYDGRDETISSLFIPNEKQWNVRLIKDRFVKEDADVILAVPIPQREVMDRVAWIDSPNGIYSAKSGYRFWYNLKFRTNAVPQSVGWKKVWHLRIPNKIKVFIWKFLRNVVPTRKRLSERGIRIGITCPICLSDIEHMTHLFFECEFARGCWEHANLVYDWSEVEYAHDWLLSKVSSAPMEEVSKICVVLWGVWHWRNKKVWDAKSVSSAFAMDSSFSIQREWLEAKGIQVVVSSHTSRVKHQEVHKWKCPDPGTIKINMDASIFQNAQLFTVGMVMRNYLGEFLAGKNLCLPMADSVFEAEALGVREALSWIKDQQLHGTKVFVESDSLLTTKAIECDKVICLEVGEVIEECKQALQNLSTVLVCFIRKNANRVAHKIARIPCLVNSQNVFTSPPTCLLEPLMFDLLS
ncbi:hypothetical protein AgCh_006084 [Apium graveolens]